MTNPYGGPQPGPQQPSGPHGGPQRQQYGPPSGPQPQPAYGSGQPQPGFAAPPPDQSAMPNMHPVGELAHWGWRALGYLVDSAILFGVNVVLVFLFFAVAIGIAAASGGSANTSNSVALLIAMIVFYVLLIGADIGYFLWNLCYRRGKTGQTIGQQVAKITTKHEHTGQPLGFGVAVGRQFLHILDGIACYIGFLFPLWDEKRQTFADKLVDSVVVHAGSNGAFGPGNPAGNAGNPGFVYPPQPGGYPGQPGYGAPQRW